jgi:hypothetical protein
MDKNAVKLSELAELMAPAVFTDELGRKLETAVGTIDAPVMGEIESSVATYTTKRLGK